MKKEKNELALFIKELFFCAAKIVIATATLLGFFYSVGCIVEVFSSVITMSMGMLALFTFGGLVFYIESIPSGHKKKSRQEITIRNREHGPVQRKIC